jgi:hypothetical protein
MAADDSSVADGTAHGGPQMAQMAQIDHHIRSPDLQIFHSITTSPHHLITRC